MSDMLLDDVKALLDKDFGDDRILKQICRACEHDEVISNYERNYVRELAEKYLGKKPVSVQTPTVESKPIVPETVKARIRVHLALEEAQTEVRRYRKLVLTQNSELKRLIEVKRKLARMVKVRDAKLVELTKNMEDQ